MGSWTAHTAADGRTYYYDRVTGKSTWTKPAGGTNEQRNAPLTLQGCLDESPAVAALFNAIVRHCGADALPSVAVRPLHGVDGSEDPLCTGGRGGGYCCASKRIFVCGHPWTSCREVAYELSHALNTCRGLVHCRKDGIRVDGEDCGYLGPPDVACSELRASFWTGRCNGRPEGPRRDACMEWHARWAVASCYPEDEHLEAHVRWARHNCRPEGAEKRLTGERSGAGDAANTFVEQCDRW